MPSGRPTRYRLTPQASTDLETIWVYTRERWSERQADAYIDDLAHCFDRLVAMPLMARERTEFTPPVRIHPHRRHLIIYRVEEDVVAVLRVVGGHQDWRDILEPFDA